MDQFEFIGRHFIVNYFGCDAGALRDNAGLSSAMTNGVQAAGATLLKTVEHAFSPSGFTLLMLLSESHASIHTYPEQNACFVDLFTCGHSCVAEKFHAVFIEYLKPRGYNQRTLLRHENIQEDTFKHREVKNAQSAKFGSHHHASLSPATAALKPLLHGVP